MLNPVIINLYSILTGVPLLYLSYSLFYSYFYNPILYILFLIPLVIAFYIVSKRFVHNQIANFEDNGSVYSLTFMVIVIFIPLTIIALILKNKVLTLFAPIPYIVTLYSIYHLTAIKVLKENYSNDFREVYIKSLKSSTSLVLSITWTKSGVLLLIMLLGLTDSYMIILLFVLSFLIDIGFYSFLRSITYQESFNIKEGRVRGKLFLFLSLILFSLLVSSNSSILPYTEILDFFNNREKVEYTGVELYPKKRSVSSPVLFSSFKSSGKEPPKALSEFWKFFEIVLYTALFLVLAFFLFKLFIIPLINYIIFDLSIEKRKKRVSIDGDTINEISGYSKKRSRKLKRVHRYSGIKREYHKLVRWYFKNISKSTPTVEELVDSFIGLKKSDIKSLDTLKILLYKGFYSRENLNHSEYKMVKSITKELLAN